MVKIGPEDIESIKFYDWIVHNKLDSVCFHPPNERKCSIQQGNILKRKGVKPGVSDYLFMRPNHRYHGLIIELKIKPNKPSSYQLKFLEDMNREGYLAVIRWSANECIETVKCYLDTATLHQ